MVTLSEAEMVSGVNMPAINVFVSMYYWGMQCRYLFMRWRNDNESTNVCLGTILLCNKYVFVFCRFSHRFIWKIYFIYTYIYIFKTFNVCTTNFIYFLLSVVTLINIRFIGTSYNLIAANAGVNYTTLPWFYKQKQSCS